ncbi:hypothetical protein RF55_19805 [Lasius niger]|uniref:Uncharacterized protein n=1 Tax=Lasius niger TaxID=67767 RepID=A0A0J7K033_LASNI|nr:hypothetical protein RF55_19805 [Lasius niger]
MARHQRAEAHQPHRRHHPTIAKSRRADDQQAAGMPDKARLQPKQPLHGPRQHPDPAQRQRHFTQIRLPDRRAPYFPPAAMPQSAGYAETQRHHTEYAQVIAQQQAPQIDCRPRRGGQINLDGDGDYRTPTRCRRRRQRHQDQQGPNRRRPRQRQPPCRPPLVNEQHHWPHHRQQTQQAPAPAKGIGAFVYGRQGRQYAA